MSSPSAKTSSRSSGETRPSGPHSGGASRLVVGLEYGGTRLRGAQEGTTLCPQLNDIRVAVANIRQIVGATGVSLLGASFGGGLVTSTRASIPTSGRRIVLLSSPTRLHKPLR
jgi:hypothetical protein